jgi:hypothetical protein
MSNIKFNINIMSNIRLFNLAYIKLITLYVLWFVFFTTADVPSTTAEQQKHKEEKNVFMYVS